MWPLLQYKGSVHLGADALRMHPVLCHTFSSYSSTKGRLILYDIHSYPWRKDLESENEGDQSLCRKCLVFNFFRD